MGELFNNILVKPIATILVGTYQLLHFLNIPYALGLAIIIMTVIIRFILYPLISAQLKSSKKLQQVAPHISRVKEKHKGDARRIQEETMRLYKEHGVNPAAGCLPVLIQMPIIWALYSMLQKIVSVDPKLLVSEVNKLVYIDALKLTAPWDPSFLGLPLGKSPAQLLQAFGFLVFIVPVATGFFQLLLSKMLVTKTSGEKTPSSEKKEDFASSFQSQSLYIFPIMIGFFSYTFSIGLSLYWNTFTIFGIIQQYKILGWGGLEGWISKIKRPKMQV